MAAVYLGNCQDVTALSDEIAMDAPHVDQYGRADQEHAHPKEPSDRQVGKAEGPLQGRNRRFDSHAQIATVRAIARDPSAAAGDLGIVLIEAQGSARLTL